MAEKLTKKDTDIDLLITMQVVSSLVDRTEKILHELKKLKQELQEHFKAHRKPLKKYKTYE